MPRNTPSLSTVDVSEKVVSQENTHLRETDCAAQPSHSPLVRPASSSSSMKATLHLPIAPAPLSNVFRLTMQPTQHDSNAAPSSSKGKRRGDGKKKNNRLKRAQVPPLATRFVVQPYPRGLINRKNLCFMNAVFQSLIFIPGFAQLAISVADSPSSFSSLSPTMCTLGKWFQAYWNSGLTRSLFPPPQFPHSRKIASFIREQHDAHEFLQCLLEEIDNELMKLERERLSKCEGSALVPSSVSKVMDLKGWTVVHKAKEKLNYTMHAGKHSILLSSLFGGLTESRVSGIAKNRISATVESFFTLSLKIGFKATCTVGEALERAFQKEEINVSDSMTLHKSMLFVELPKILIVHLCRWAITAEGEVVKIDNAVTCPSTLTIPPHLCADRELPPSDRLYRLLSVVAHRGTEANSGHYVTYLSPVHTANPFSVGGGHASCLAPGGHTGETPSTAHYVSAGSSGTSTAAQSSPSLPSRPCRSAVPSGHFIRCNDADVSLVNGATLKNEAAYLMVFEKQHQ